MPVSKPFFSAFSIASCAVPVRFALLDEGRELRVVRRGRSASGWSGAIAMNFAPNSVSGRVV